VPKRKRVHVESYSYLRHIKGRERRKRIHVEGYYYYRTLGPRKPPAPPEPAPTLPPEVFPELYPEPPRPPAAPPEVPPPAPPAPPAPPPIEWGKGKPYKTLTEYISKKTGRPVSKEWAKKHPRRVRKETSYWSKLTGEKVSRAHLSSDWVLFGQREVAPDQTDRQVRAFKETLDEAKFAGFDPRQVSPRLDDYIEWLEKHNPEMWEALHQTGYLSREVSEQFKRVREETGERSVTERVISEWHMPGYEPSIDELAEEDIEEFEEE
jgi:hypothetical protein